MKKTILSLIGLVVFASFTSFSQGKIKKTAQPTQNTKPYFKKKISAPAAAKTATFSLPLRSVNYYWDNMTNLWQYSDSSLYTYNNFAYLSNETKRNGNLIDRTTYTFDAQNRETQSLYQFWDQSTNSWVNQYRNVTIYDIHDNQIEFRSDSYNTTTNLWEIQYGYKNLITYNANNKITDNISQTYNSANNLWEDDYRVTNYIYNSNNIATQYDNQIKNGAVWDNQDRIKDTYDLQNKLVDEVVQSWNGTAYVNVDRYTNVNWHNWTGDLYTSAVGSYTSQTWGSPLVGQWNTVARTSVTYDNFGGNVDLEEDYVGSAWVNNARYSNFYDSYFNYTGFRGESWNSVTNSWEVNFEDKVIITYDLTGNFTQKIWQYWDSQTSALMNNEKRVYSGTQVFVGLNSFNSDAISLSVFPNPFSSTCTLRFENTKQEVYHSVELKLYDMYGKEVYEQEISGNEVKIERGNLPAGVYFYLLMDKTNSLAKGKLVIE